MKLKSTMFFSSTALALAMAFGGAQAQDKAAERYKPNNELISSQLKQPKARMPLK